MNLRFAFRRLRAAPGFASAAVLTLALGIGVNALTFSALRMLLIQPLPFPDGDALVWVQGTNLPLARQNQPIGGDEVEAIATGVPTLEGIAVIGTRTLIRAAGERREEWRGLWVSANALTLLKVTPALGRAFLPADASDGPVRPALIGYERWQRDFGGDPAILGRVLQFEDRKSVAVIGVLPAGLAFPFGRAPGAGTGSEFRVGVQDFWTLGQNRPDEYPGGIAFARLRQGASLSGAQTDADAAISRVPRASAAAATRSVRLVGFRDHALGTLRPALPLLAGFAALVLLIACANLANLMLARAEKTRGEFAVRRALGATLGHLTTTVLGEHLLLAAGGIAGGLALAAAGRAFLVAFAGERLAAIDRLRIDTIAVVVATIVAAACAVALTLLSIRIVHGTPSPSMSDRSGRGHTTGRRQTRVFTALVVVQVAMTLVLLNGAALLFRSLSKLLTVDAGYQSATVVAADVLLYEPPPVFVPYFQQLHDRLRALPGVESVGLVQSTPLTGKWTFRERLAVPGWTDPGRHQEVAGSLVAFDYFDAMGIPILDGRTFTAREYLTGDQRAVIVNDAAARMFFTGERAVDRELLLDGRPRRVVGVVRGTRDVRLDTPAAPQFYQPAFTGGSQVIVRTSLEPRAFAAVLRRELAASDPRLIVKSVEPLAAILESSVFDRGLATRLLAALAGLALALAVVGLYGVVNFTTVQWRREIGIRAALGARPARLVRMVLGEGLVMTVAGVAAGLAISLPAAAWIESLLFEVPARDPVTTAGTVTALICTAVAACALPAYRAASVSPMLTLRADE